jgi:hypothetical protein
MIDLKRLETGGNAFSATYVGSTDDFLLIPLAPFSVLRSTLERTSVRTIDTGDFSIVRGRLTSALQGSTSQA